MKTESIKVTGLHCHGCEMNVQDSIEELPGIKKVDASAKTGLVKVEFDETKSTVDKIKSKIKEAGYTPN